MPLPPVIAKCERGIITEVVNIGDINICVTALGTGVLPPKIKSSRKVSVESAINYDEFIRRRKAYKSVYLDYLDYITLNVPPRAFSNVPLQIWSL